MSKIFFLQANLQIQNVFKAQLENELSIFLSQKQEAFF
jgi:hypothetical protein